MGDPICARLFGLDEMSREGLFPKMVEIFTELAQRAGDPAVVDSCDLKDFYEHEGATEGRLLYRPDFMTKTLDREGFASPIFNYQALFDHLQKTKGKNPGFSKARKMWSDLVKEASEKGEGSDGWEQATTTASETVKQWGPKLQGMPEMRARLLDLARRYPYWLDSTKLDKKKEIPFPATFAFDMDTEAVVAIGFMSGAVIPFRKWGTVIQLPEGRWVIAEVTGDPIGRIDFYDPTDQKTYWLRLDLQPLWRWLGATEVEDVFDKIPLDQIPMPISTNMTAATWNRLVEYWKKNKVLSAALGAPKQELVKWIGKKIDEANAKPSP